MSLQPDEDPNTPEPLNYQRLKDEPYQARTPFGLQMVAGFFTWILGLVFIIQAVRGQAAFSFIPKSDTLNFSLAAVFIGLGGLTIWLRLRFRWKGFIPGLLLGLGLTCLVPIGIVLVICGIHK